MTASSSGRTRPQAGSRGLFYSLVTFVLLAFVIPLTSVSGIRFAAPPVAVAYGLMTYGAWRLALLVGSGRVRMLDTAMWVFYYSFLTLPLLAQVNSGEYVLGTNYSYSRSTTTTVEALILFGVLGYEVAYRLAQRRPEREAAARPLHVSARRAYVLGYVGLLFVLYAVAKHGLGSFFTSRDALTQNFLGPAQAGGVKFYLNANKAAGATLEELAQVPTFIGCYLLLYLRHASKLDNTIRRPALTWITPLILGNIIINNPVANARFWWVTVVIGFASIYMPFRTKRSWARLFVILFVATSLFSFHQLAAFRRTGTTDFSSGGSLSQNLLTNPDYASPQQMLNGVEYVHEYGYRLGEQLAGTLLVEVPRALWAGKPSDTGQLVGGAAGFKVSAPIFTEGQIDWGIIGTVLYLAVIGVLACRLDRRYRRSRDGDLLAAFTPIMASLLVFVLRGSLQPAFGSILPVAASLFFAASRRQATAGNALSRRTRPTRAPLPRVSSRAADSPGDEVWDRALGLSRSGQ